MKFYFFIATLFFFGKLSAQDLTGTWEGKGSMGVPYVKMVIVKVGDSYIGYSYDEGGGGYCKANFLGQFDEQSQKLKGKGQGMIEKRGPHGQAQFSLKYSSSGGVHYLRGNVTPKTAVAKVLSMGIPQSVDLKRTSRTFDTTAYMRTYLSEPEKTIIEIRDDTVANTVSEEEKEIITSKQERRADTISTIQTSAKKLKIKIIDNGVVDNDSVSVLFDDQLVATKIKVMAVAFVVEIELDDIKKMHTITLVAHNLGSIPPNTALLLIMAGDKEYKLSASSDFTKNAVIVIKYPE